MSGASAPAPLVPAWFGMTSEQKLEFLCDRIGRLALEIDNLRQGITDANTEITGIRQSQTHITTQMTADRAHFDTQLQGASNQVGAILTTVNQIVSNQTTPGTGAQGQGQQGAGQGIGIQGQQGTVGGGTTTQTTSPKPIKMAKPETFDGSKHEELSKFVTSCKLYMNSNLQGADEDQKVAFIISFLTGSACTWVQSYLEQDMIHNINIPWLHNSEDFWNKMATRYGQINKKEEYRQDLKKLRQKGTVQDYLTEFQRLASMLGSTDAPLRDAFYDNLSDEIKQNMVAQNFNPMGGTFKDLADRALLIDQFIRQYKLTSNQSNSNSSNKPLGKTTVTSVSSQPAREKFAKGDYVYTLGTDGKAVKGQITNIGKNPKGFLAPTVKWAATGMEAQTRFDALKKDSRPSAAPPTKKQSPTPTDLDAMGKGKNVITCNRCGGKGHMVRDCPSAPMSGFKAEVEEVDTDEETLKDEA